MSETLIERLRQNANSLRQGGNVHRRFHEDYEEAADALTVAQARIERLERVLEKIRDSDGPMIGVGELRYWAGSVLFPDQEGELVGRDPAGQATREPSPDGLGPTGECPSRAVLRRLEESLSEFEAETGDAWERDERSDLWEQVIEVAIPDVRQIVRVLASAGEARSDETRSGSVEDEHAAPQSGETPDFFTAPLDTTGYLDLRPLPPSPTTEERLRQLRGIREIMTAVLSPDRQTEDKP